MLRRVNVLKVAGLSMVTQIVLCFTLGVMTYVLSPQADYLAGSIIYLYYPTIYAIWWIGFFGGEKNMFLPILIGVPLGILIYSILSVYMFQLLQLVFRRTPR